MDEFTISRPLESPGLNDGLGRSSSGRKRRRDRKRSEDPQPEDTARDRGPDDPEGRRSLDVLA
jgi:hypothetical protein